MNHPDGMHYLDGQWVSTADLKISVFDLSVLRGFGAFDYLRTYNNKPFHLDDHLKRFENSARLLNLEIPATRTELTQIVEEGLSKNHFPETGIRFLLTGGLSVDSMTVAKPMLIVIFQPTAVYAAELYKDGAKLITWPTPRYIAEAKSLNYLTAIVAMQKATAEDAIEAIYVDPELEAIAEHTSRKIYEGTRTNFFIIKDGVLVTPHADVLAGITRQVVIHVAERLGLPVEERLVELSELDLASEAFITSSDKEIIPVTQIDETVIGDGKVGPATKGLMTAFKEYTAGA